MTERNYCWQIHLPVELILPAKSVCIVHSTRIRHYYDFIVYNFSLGQCEVTTW
jgi:hypothetical protein